MKLRRQLRFAIFGWTTLMLAALAGLDICAVAQQPAEAPAATGTTIRAESRLVLVDVVVTDKKGNYIEDLTEKDFRISQDDQQQKITSFSFEKSGGPGTSEKRYLVLFFDDDSMQAADQSRARAAAVKFLETNAQPGNYFSILDYAGTLQVTQGFTDDGERLKKVAATRKMSISGAENASLSGPVFANYDSFSNRNVLLALRSVARNLASIPGRKSLIWITAGFAVSPDIEPEITALINACNKANVAVYPLDVRGISGSVTTGRLESDPMARPPASFLQAAEYEQGLFSDGSPSTTVPHLVYVAQTKPGSGGQTGGTGGRPPGGTGGTTNRPPTVTRTIPSRMPTSLSQQPRTIVPQIPPSTAINQQVLYTVAIGAGGFVIGNTNDLLAGFQKIGKEQSEYYSLGYVPPESSENACHTLQVKVDHSGYIVRSRSGYCATKPVDYLAGKPIAKTLEAHAMGTQPGDISGTVAAPYFYTAPGTARVNLAVDIPGKAFQFDKVKGKQQATLNVLGMALKPDGTVAARFSDSVDVSLDKSELNDFAKRPYHYDNQFYIAAGGYTLKIAVSSGDKYGQFEMPLVVDHYDPAKFTMSDLAMSTQFYKVSELSTSLDAELLQDRTPLITQGLQMVPAGSNRFRSSDSVAIYLEVYEPLVANANSPKVGLHMKIIDKNSGAAKLEASVPDTAASVVAGNPVIPMGVPLPVNRLQPGTYVVELSATDAAGHVTPTRKAEFAVE